MNILFHSNQICERGTEIALFDYATGNQSVLHNASFIASPYSGVQDATVLEKFRNSFEVCLYRTSEELAAFIKEKKIELIYKIVHGGKKEDIIVDNVPRFIHCVFSTKRKFGTFYCPISNFLNNWYNTKYPVLPHIVKKFPGVTGTLRDTLHIPSNAIVFGGYGGHGCFNIKFVQKAVCEVARQRNDIYFIFLNFASFIPDNETFTNIIFLPKNIDLTYKETFINTCDAMIHARSDGETFGLSVAEFSIKNKPVITFAPDLIHNTKLCLKEMVNRLLGRYYAYAKAHLDFLGEKAIRYSCKKDLLDIFYNFTTSYLRPINYDCYSEQFSEERVMKLFKQIIRRAT